VPVIIPSTLPRTLPHATSPRRLTDCNCLPVPKVLNEQDGELSEWMDMYRDGRCHRTFGARDIVGKDNNSFDLEGMTGMSASDVERGTVMCIMYALALFCSLCCCPDTSSGSMFPGQDAVRTSRDRKSVV